MKKLVVLGLLLAMSTGCGRGWFPHLFRGAPCNGLCSTQAPSPTLTQGCEGCAGHSGGYEAGYENGGMVGESYDGGNVIGSSNPGYEAPQNFMNIPSAGTNTPNIVMPTK